MGFCRATILTIILFVLLSFIVLGAPGPIVVGEGTQTESGVPQDLYYTMTQGDIDKFRDVILEGVNANNDDNFRFFDERMNAYMQSMSMKIIIGAIGVNCLVAGLVYYFLIRKNRDLSYESISLKRKKEIDDRNFLADSINQMRDRYEQLEEYLKNEIQPNLYTLEQLSLQRRSVNDGSVRTGGQAFQQEQSGYGGGGQGFAANVPMANQGYVQEPFQVQGQYPYRNEYEQPPPGPGWYDRTYQ